MERLGRVIKFTRPFSYINTKGKGEFQMLSLIKEVLFTQETVEELKAVLNLVVKFFTVVFIILAFTIKSLKELVKLFNQVSKQLEVDNIKEDNQVEKVEEVVIIETHNNELLDYGWVEEGIWYPVVLKDNNQLGIDYKGSWLVIEKDVNESGDECYGITLPNKEEYQIYPRSVWMSYNYL